MKNKQITFGALLSYVAIAVNLLAGLFYTPWMISTIGQSNYGLYTLSQSVIALFLMDFGLCGATIKYVSKYLAEGNQQGANVFLGAISKLYLMVDCIFLLAFTMVFLFADQIFVSLNAEEMASFKVIYLIAAIYSVLSFPFVTLNGILVSYEQFVVQKIADIAYRSITVVLTVVALLNGLGLYALVIVNVISGVLIIAFKVIAVKVNTPAKFVFTKNDIALYKEVFFFSFWTTLVAISQRLIFSISPSILAIVSNTTAIAVFGVITTVEGHSYTISTAINGMFMPRVARIYTSDNSAEEMQRLMEKVGRFMFFVNGLIVVGFAVLGKQFISLWMGSDYLEAYYGVLLVILPSLFYNSLEIANSAMIMQNKIKLQGIIALITGIINVALSFVLSYYFGAVGAATSICIAYAFRSVAYHIVHQRVMKFNMLSFAKHCYLKAVPAIALTIIAGIGVNLLPIGEGIVSFIVRGVIVCVVYFISMFVFYINKTEKRNIFSKLINKVRG